MIASSVTSSVGKIYFPVITRGVFQRESAETDSKNHPDLLIHEACGTHGRMRPTPQIVQEVVHLTTTRKEAVHVLTTSTHEHPVVGGVPTRVPWSAPVIWFDPLPKTHESPDPLPAGTIHTFSPFPEVLGSQAG